MLSFSGTKVVIKIDGKSLDMPDLSLKSFENLNYDNLDYEHVPYTFTAHFETTKKLDQLVCEPNPLRSRAGEGW